ncbi:MAG: family 20 glycosylhydrolase [Phocaeicola sp.]
MNIMKSLLTLFLFVVSLTTYAQNQKEPSLIPYPKQIKLSEGEFILSSQTQLIQQENGLFWSEIAYLQEMLASVLGKGLSHVPGTNSLAIVYSEKVRGAEGYELEITPEVLTIKACTPQGAFYAIQTIRQLLPAGIESRTIKAGSITLPTLQIADEPSFEWRGSMMDVSRHFFSLQYMKAHVDRLALYKMNKLHLHLTDDQGWRIEIKKYPELTNQGAWRTYNNQDSVCMKKAVENPDFEIDSRYMAKNGGKELYGGYYTQADIKELVAYAATKHVEIIPEIDMPGHMQAAINAYPFLTDAESGWGELFSVPVCPCKEESYTFIENVLAEVIELFPSQYIHIGADEVDKTTWEQSLKCKEIMEREGIKDIEELQSYFVHRVQDFIEAKGKKVIAWDEALDGGINPNVNIMYWRGWVANSPQKAANNGNPIIMSPTNPLYFDYAPDKSSLSSVYNMDVIYHDIPQGKEHLIRGAQANLWTEYVPSEKRADFMLFPRLTALAERLWTNQPLFESYNTRLLAHFPRMDEMKINYRLPDLTGFASESVYLKDAYFTVDKPLEGMTIHYTTDGSLPTMESATLHEPLKITKPTQIKMTLFSNSGAKGDIYTVNYRKTTLSKAAKVDAKKLQSGLKCELFKPAVKNTKEMKGEADAEMIASNIIVPKEFILPHFCLRYTGYIKVPETGIYTFFLTCDDGGMLYINNEVTVDNDGRHSAIEKSGQAAMSKGAHPFRIDFLEGGGGFTLKLQYSLNGSKPQDVPDEWFIH